MSSELRCVLFGSCLVRRPIKSAERAKSVLGFEDSGPIDALHSFGEMIQAIEVLRSQKTIPRELWRLCHVSTKVANRTDSTILEGLDLALIEVSLPVDFVFRGYFINRDAIVMHILNPLIKSGQKRIGKLAQRWLRKGLIGRNETARANAAEELAISIEGDDPKRELARAVLRETRALPTDLAAGFHKMKEMLACPVGAVVYTFRVMPDGRPVSWPAGFREDIIAAARKHELPMFETSEMVRDFGVANAFTKDMRHYSEAFSPLVGEALLQFAEKICADTRAAADEPR